MSWFLAIRYDEGSPETYRGVQLSYGDGRNRFGTTVNSGRPTVDLHAAWRIVHAFESKRGNLLASNDVHVLGSSSIDQFVFDGGDLREADAISANEIRQSLRVARAWRKKNPKADPFLVVVAATNAREAE